MIRLLHIEFIKLWNNRASKVLILAYFILLACIALIASIKFNIGPIKFHLAEQGIFNFPYIWHFNTYVAASLKFFLAVVIVSMMANEYSNKTIKQNLIDGLSKKEFIASKFLTVIVFSLISTIFVFIISLLLGYSFSSITEPYHVFSDLEYLIAFFIKLVGFFSFCLFLGILIKRSAFALGFLFVWFVGEKIAYGFLRFEIEATKNNWESITQFFPLESMSNLIKEPITRLGAAKELAKQVGEKYSFDYAVHFHELLIVVGWISIFTILSYTLLQKRDL
ncbi:ABC transporter permease [Aurantibacter aestuarii]|uniref:ABC transporter permease n=1 Tax=Aurantibacter aestuarii TaxID=1266046 RepID=A0A2T1N9W5_9FLAO|nr:ABC transporter permease subunit [Aurantibacter aestuarii]PSG88666.1 ABC transporter permease [Aurantibacter aestuarii]